MHPCPPGKPDGGWGGGVAPELPDAMLPVRLASALAAHKALLMQCHRWRRRRRRRGDGNRSDVFYYAALMKHALSLPLPATPAVAVVAAAGRARAQHGETRSSDALRCPATAAALLLQNLGAVSKRLIPGFVTHNVVEARQLRNTASIHGSSH